VKVHAVVRKLRVDSFEVGATIVTQTERSSGGGPVLLLHRRWVL
jgi:hypothetical protein